MSPALLGAFAALFWGVHDLVAGISSRKIGHLITVLGVTAFGLLALTVWLMLSSGLPDVQRADIWVPLMAGVGYGAATLFLFSAFAVGPFSIAAPVGGSYPLTSMLIAFVFGNPTSVAQLVAAFAIIGGVVLVALTDSPGEAKDKWSPAAIRQTLIRAGLAHVSFAFAIFMGQESAVLFGAVEGTWIGRCAGLVLILALAFVSKQPRTMPRKWVAPIAAIGVLDATAISFLNAAGTSDQPHIAAVAGSAFGVVTIVAARIILKEHIPPKRWLGIAITFAGVAVLASLK